MYLDKIISEFPEQFKNKANIRVLVAAFSRQLDELRAMFDDLETKRSLETATGKQLDGVGDIVVLSRREAGLLAGVKITFPVIDDERYRKYLKYKVLKNTNSCTYYDLIYGLTMLYGSAIEPIYYSEDPDLPATIILEMPMLQGGGVPATIGDVPPIKAAGVAIEIMYRIRVMIEIRSLITFGQYEFWLCGPHLCGTLPWQYQIGKVVRSVIETGADVENVLHALNIAGTLMAPGDKFQYQIGERIEKQIEFRTIRTDVEVKTAQTGTIMAGGDELQYQLGKLVKVVGSLEAHAGFVETEPGVSGQLQCGNGYVVTNEVDATMEASEVIRHVLIKPLICGDEACGIDFTGKEGK